GAFQAAEEPEPALREGEGDFVRARDGNECRPRWLGKREPFGEPGYRRGLEQRTDSKLNAKNRADTAADAGSQERVPPQLKEVVVYTDPWHTKGLGKDCAEDLLLGGA